MGKLHRARSQGSLLAIVKKANFDPKNNKRPGVDLYNPWEGRGRQAQSCVLPAAGCGMDWRGVEGGWESSQEADLTVWPEMVAAWSQVVVVMQGGEQIPELQRE